MDYDKAYAFMMEKLEEGIPDYLTYHNADHTQKVIDSSVYLAEKEGIAGNDLVLLKTAALFHDTGFLQSHVDHEQSSCALASKHLPQFGYNQEQITIINNLIRGTRIPQTPVSSLGRILCDADLSYLGEDNYDLIANKLYSEFRSTEQISGPEEWVLRQYDFLKAHSYFTDTAKAEKNGRKEKVIQKVKEELEALPDANHNQSHWISEVQDFFLITVGVFFSALALNYFMVPNKFFDGGITGIALLMHEIYHINLTILIIGLNIPLIIASLFVAGKKFAMRMIIAVALLGVFLLILPPYAITADKLLICIFGGAFLGLGVGLVMRAGTALDGIEILALYTLKKTSFTISEIILAINIVIFSIAAFTFGIETALYSIITYFTATRTIDYVVEGFQAYTGVTIISGKSEIIKFQLVNRLGRAITVYKGERGFLPGKFHISSECEIIFTVITRLELRRLLNVVKKEDPKAFVFASTIREASGGIIKRRRPH